MVERKNDIPDLDFDTITDLPPEPPQVHAVADAIRAELARLATGAHRTITDRRTRLEDWCASKAVVQVTGDNEITITHPTRGDAVITYAIDGATQNDANGWIDPTDTPKLPGRTIYRPRS